MEAHIAAHEFSSNNYDSIRASKMCGCFYCGKIFPAEEVLDWYDDKTKTATCPYCTIDSVIGDQTGYPITKEFLQRMKEYWF